MPVDQERRSSYGTSPEERARLWTKEFTAAKEWLSKWREKGEVVVAAFLDERNDKDENETHLNFYWATVKTMMALLYGRTPRVSVSRRHSDPNDDLARVGANMMERLLNTDVERYDDGYRDALAYCLCDFLIPGYGCARVRYWAEFEDYEQPARGRPGTRRYAAPVKGRRKVRGQEDVCTDYVYWADQRWSPCRTHADKRWHAFMSPMTRDGLHDRFDATLGPKEVDAIPLNGHLFGADEKVSDGGDDPWARAEVWEIWDKQRREVVWFVEGYPRTLDVKPDPLGLVGFWPCPRPLMANVTTTKHLPRPDYAMAQDLYHDINVAATRVSELEDALRVAGAYDASLGGLKRLMENDCRNELVPIQGFPALAEKGGLEKVISWLPMAEVAATLVQLKEQLADKQRQLYEVTGWYDVMRGQVPAGQPQTAAATQAMVRTGSVRVQSVQDEFARYASDLQRLRAEVIIKFFDDETILARSNILNTPDKDLAVPALKALRKDFSKYAVEVKPEAVALADFAALKAERTEFLGAFSKLMESGGSLLQLIGPQNGAAVLPLVIELVKWTMAGYRGSSSIEGVLDKLLSAAQQAAQQAAAAGPQVAPPDPKLQAQQAKFQADMAREAAKVQGEAQRQDIKTRAEAERQRIQLEANVQEAREEARIKAEARAAQQATSRPGGAS